MKRRSWIWLAPNLGLLIGALTIADAVGLNGQGVAGAAILVASLQWILIDLRERIDSIKPGGSLAVASLVAALAFAHAIPARAKEISTNAVEMSDAPAWLTQTRVEKVTDRIQGKLEWTIRKVPVYWYSNAEEYGRAQSLGPLAMAVTEVRGDEAKVHLGPLVNNSEFDAVFGHELVHVIVAQKYKTSIPKWLEEGLANHVAKRGAVDYKWLAQQTLPDDVTQLAHPFQGNAAAIGMRYRASQALAEMLDKKCGLENLIRLSVQRKMENYIQTYCEIKDLNAAFKDWVKKKAKGA